MTTTTKNKDDDTSKQRTDPNADKQYATETDNKDVVLRSGEVVTQADLYEGYAADAGAGFDHQTSEDTGIPNLLLLQPGSPEVSEAGSALQRGQWFIRGPNIAFSLEGGASFVAAVTRHVLREWESKEPSGNPPVADHDISSDLAVRVRRDQPFGQYFNPDNPEHPLIETYDVFGITLTDDGGAIPCMVNFSSTHIRPYRDWMTRARSIVIDLGAGRKLSGERVPLFSHAYNFRSKRVDKKPYSWEVPVVSFADPAGAVASRLAPSDTLYQLARDLRKNVLDGAVKVAAPVREVAGDEKLDPADKGTEKAPY